MSTTTPIKPVRPHTRAASADYFNHVFALFDTDLISSIILGLQNKLGTAVTLMEFIALPPEDLALMVFEDEDGDDQRLTRSELRLTKNIQNWVKYEVAIKRDIDFEKLTMDNYNDFLLSYASQFQLAPATVPTPVQSSTTPTAPVPSVPAAMSYTPVSTPVPAPMPSPTQMTPGYNPISYMNPSPSPSTSPFMINVKLDVKTYPVFNGENASWPKFRRGVTSIASTQNL